MAIYEGAQRKILANRSVVLAWEILRGLGWSRLPMTRLASRNQSSLAGKVQPREDSKFPNEGFMATQDSNEIDVQFSHSQQGFRLLELPASLLEVVRSDTCVSLDIKSASNLSTRNASPLTPHHAVLCTESQTFEIRQVQSSNSLFLVKSPQVDFNSEPKDTPPNISIIGSSRATLELLPTTPPSSILLRSATTTWERAVSNREDQSGVLSSSPPRLDKRSKSETFESIPISRGEFDQAWIECGAFEEEGVAYLPSAEALLGTWKAILSTAITQGVDLDSRIGIEDLYADMSDDGYPRPLVEAVIARLSVATDVKPNSGPSIDKMMCIAWIGGLVLQTPKTQKDPWSISDFLEKWRDSLPEPWTSQISLDLLKVPWAQPMKGYIQYQEYLPGIALTDQRPNVAVTKSTSSSRKWHDRFRSAGK